MSGRTRGVRSLVLLAVNALLLGLLAAWGSVRPFTAEPGDDGVLAIPDHALIVEGKAVQVRILRQSGNFALDVLGQVQFGPSDLNSKAELEVELTGEVTVTLANSPTEVLSGATVRYEIPQMGLQGQLSESSTGRYTGTLTTRAVLTSDRPLDQVDPQIASWRCRSSPGFLNNRLVTTFSFLDYRARTVFSSGRPAGTYVLPLSFQLQGRITQASGTPVANKTLSGRLEIPAQGHAETVQMSTDAQGRVAYDRREEVRVSVEGGSLRTLASPLRLNPPSRTLTVVDPGGVSRDYTLPLALSSSDPVVLFWWGELDKIARLEPTPLEKKTFGKSEVDDHIVGKDPIDLTTGNVFTSFLDFSMPGRGLGISFERTYNSRDDTSGPMGFGWTHSYSARLEEQGDGALAEIDEDGTWRFYAPQPDGSFSSPPGEYGVLSRQPDGSYRIRRKGGMVLAFQPDGKMSFLEDPNGNRVSLAYNGSGLLTSVQDPAGGRLDLFYDTSGRIIRLVGPEQREVSYEYAGEDLVASTDPEGGRTEYAYDTAHQLLQIRDPRGFLSGFSYDTSNRAKAFSYEQQQHKVVLTYDPDAQTATVTNARAFQTVHHYEEIGGIRLVTRRTDAVTGEHSSTWDSRRNRTRVTDPLGRITRFAYDGRGNLTRVTDPAGNATDFTYEPAFDRLIGIHDASGRDTFYFYDARGNLVETRNPLSETTRFAYDASGQLTGVTDPRGKTTAYAYDSRGNLTSVTDPLGRSTLFSYDGVGNVVSVTDPLSRTTRFSYDRKNRLTAVTGADNETTRFTYDASGNRIAVSDPAGLSTSYEYDPAGRLVGVTDPADMTTRYEYDPEGNLVRVTDAGGRRTDYAYDGADRLTSVRDALDQVARYEYDAAGNRAKETRPDGSEMIYAYDALNRLTGTSSRPAGAPQAEALVSFAYDALGRRVSMTDSRGATAYGYDAAGRMISVDGSGAADTFAYQYDAAGNRTRMTGPSGNATAYAYDAANRLLEVSFTETGSASAPRSFTYSYDAAGNLSSLMLPNGLTTTYSHDALNRLTRLVTRTAQNAVLADLGYAYDASGRRVRTSGQLPGVSGAVPFAVDYAYDPAGRLTGEERTQSAPYAILYAYDPSGNRVGMTRDGLKTLWESDAANRLVSVRQEGIPAQVDVLAEGTTDDPGATVTVEGVRAALDAGQTPPRWSATVSLAEGDHELTVAAVDALGNRQEVKRSVSVIDPTRRDYLYSAPGELTEEKRPWTGERTLYAYDALSRLRKVSRAAGGLPAGTAPAELAAYEYDGEGKRVMVTEGGVTTASLYDGLLAAVERWGSATAAVNVWGLSLGGGIGGLLARHDPGATDPAKRFLYPLYDGTGNILAWTDEGGAVVSATSYTAFGEAVTQTGAAQPYAYSTKAFSATTGLSYFGARHYRADLARWLTPDPLGMPDGPNRYHFAGNSPPNYIDPDGSIVQAALGAIIGGVIGGSNAYASGGDFRDIVIGTSVGVIGGAFNPGGAIYSAFIAGGASLGVQFAKQLSRGQELHISANEVVFSFGTGFITGGSGSGLRRFFRTRLITRSSAEITAIAGTFAVPSAVILRQTFTALAETLRQAFSPQEPSQVAVQVMDIVPKNPVIRRPASHVKE